MTPIKDQTFFRVMLCLPILTPLVLLPFGLNAVIGVMLLSLTFGGIQYIIFALVLFFIIGRIKEINLLKRLLNLAPLLFLPVQIIGWLLSGYIERLSNPNLTGIWGALVPFTFYVLVIGYCYVGLIYFMYGLCRRLGWVGEAR
jgi:hypothetical protein